MLQYKDTAKISEIKTLFKESWMQPEFFLQQINFFNFTKASQMFKSIKKSGVPVWDILKLLFILPFTNTPNINSLYTSKMQPKVSGEKDVYYRLLGNQKINWRSLLLLFVKQYAKQEMKFSKLTELCKCLIFDDTDIKKKGKKTEGVSKIYNHVSHSFFFGYKLLVAGYWNGSVFIPVDFSFHRESKNSKNKYGLSVKELKAQNRTKRGKGTAVLKRFKELNSKKNDIVIQMFKRINQRKIDVDYILTDSWFTSTSFIKNILKVNKKVHVIGMYKYNSKVVINEKGRTIKQLRKSKKGIKRSRLTGFYYMSFTGEIDGITLKIFLSRKGKHGAWHTLVTTNTLLSFNQIVKIYNIRWSIEVFFKEAKQLLGLGRYQSTNFDVQIAQTTITMIQYLMISLKYRMEAYETMGGLFKDLKQDYIEHKLNERIWAVIIILFTILEQLGVDFDCELTVINLINYIDNDCDSEKNENSINFCKLAS